MRVSDLILMFKEHYKPDDEIVIFYWDKESTAPDLTNDQWGEVVDECDYLESKDLNDEIAEIAGRIENDY